MKEIVQDLVFVSVHKACLESGAIEVKKNYKLHAACRILRE